MIVYRRAIAFDEVDAAGIVFFGQFIRYAHEAMERFFDALEGGYRRMIVERKTGFPAVHVDMDFASPARYGDVLEIETTVLKIGNRSLVFSYEMFQFGSRALVCEMKHTVVVTDLVAMKSADMPGDVRALLEAHLEAP